MPADDSVGLDDDEDVSPAGPTTAKGRPEKSVQPVQCLLRSFAFERSDLLAEGENLKSHIALLCKNTRTTASMERMNSGTNSLL